MDKRVALLLERFTQLESERRSFFQSDWQSLSQYFLPSQSSINTQKTPGTVSGWTDRIYDTTPIHCGQVLAAGQRNWLTPSNEKWFDFEVPEFLSSPDRDEEKDEAAQWLANATDVAAREIARSNFYGQVNIDYEQVGIFGTGIMYLEEGKKNALNFRQFKPWFCAIEEDDEGIVDTVFREFELTTRQAVQQFGLENLGQNLQKAHAAGKDATKRWKFLHYCGPRADTERDTKAKNGENKPWASIYISVDDKKIVEESGYDEMPYLVSRFKSWGAPTCWGYSPAYLTLPAARQLNYVAQYRDALEELQAYPRFLYPDNLEGDVDLRPGGVTTYDSSNPSAKPEEWATVGSDKGAEENMERKKQELYDAFYVNMFTMLEQLADKKMTAYEIAQRLAEKLEQFTPVFDRRVSEFLNPLLLRVFGILFRQGKFGRPPPSLLVPVDGGRGAALAMPVVAITSRISMALRALQNQALVNTLSVIQPLVQVQPEIIDNFDMDKLVRQLARNYGMTPDVIRPLMQMSKIRAARAEAAAAQQAAELAQRMSASAGDLGKAPPELQNAIVEQFTGTPTVATG